MEIALPHTTVDLTNTSFDIILMLIHLLGTEEFDHAVNHTTATYGGRFGFHEGCGAGCRKVFIDHTHVHTYGQILPANALVFPCLPPVLTTDY